MPASSSTPAHGARRASGPYRATAACSARTRITIVRRRRPTSRAVEASPTLRRKLRAAFSCSLDELVGRSSCALDVGVREWLRAVARLRLQAQEVGERLRYRGPVFHLPELRSRLTMIVAFRVSFEFETASSPWCGGRAGRRRVRFRPLRPRRSPVLRAEVERARTGSTPGRGHRYPSTQRRRVPRRSPGRARPARPRRFEWVEARRCRCRCRRPLRLSPLSRIRRQAPA
jgi:hypothetical protein